MVQAPPEADASGPQLLRQHLLEGIILPMAQLHQAFSWVSVPLVVSWATAAVKALLQASSVASCFCNLCISFLWEGTVCCQMNTCVKLQSPLISVTRYSLDAQYLVLACPSAPSDTPTYTTGRPSLTLRAAGPVLSGAARQIQRFGLADGHTAAQLGRLQRPLAHDARSQAGKRGRRSPFWQIRAVSGGAARCAGHAAQLRPLAEPRPSCCLLQEGHNTQS